VQRSSGPLVLGPPKSRAGRRTVGIPAAIIPDLKRHLAVYIKPQPGALVFPGVKSGPIRRTTSANSPGGRTQSRNWACRGCTSTTSGTLATSSPANSGAGLRDLMARMGDDSARAALIYQHEARGADKAITDAIDAHVTDEQH
jgi:hypothetical protein